MAKSLNRESEEQELKGIIHQAWYSGDKKDTFGAFLTRAAKGIKEAGYKSPEEIKQIIQQSAHKLSNKHKREVNEASLDKSFSAQLPAVP